MFPDFLGSLLLRSALRATTGLQWPPGTKGLMSSPWRPQENPGTSHDPSGLCQLVCLQGGGIREMPLNVHLPRIPLMLFPSLENFLVLIDLIA